MNTEKIFWLPEGTVLKNGERDLKIIDKKGNGSFGVTYLAELILSEYSQSAQKKVIVKEFFLGLKKDGTSNYCYREGKEVKVFPDEESDFDYYIGLFWKESDKLHQLKACTNTVNVIDRFQENNTCYFVMEYIEGVVDLADYVKNNGKLNETITREIIRQIGSVLLVAHSEKLYHRDVKPSNILFNEQSNKAYLIDFGIAKNYFKEDGKEVKLTGVATREYAPPEQANGNIIDEAYLGSLDVYALAKTMYFCITGDSPGFGEFKPVDLENLPNEIIKEAIEKATKGEIENRTKRIETFFEELNIDPEGTFFTKRKAPESEPKQYEGQKPQEPEKPEKVKKMPRNTIVIACIALFLIVAGILLKREFTLNSKATTNKVQTDSTQQVHLPADNNKTDTIQKETLPTIDNEISDTNPVNVDKEKAKTYESPQVAEVADKGKTKGTEKQLLQDTFQKENTNSTKEEKSMIVPNAVFVSYDIKFSDGSLYGDPKTQIVQAITDAGYKVAVDEKIAKWKIKVEGVANDIGKLEDDWGYSNCVLSASIINSGEGTVSNFISSDKQKAGGSTFNKAAEKAYGKATSILSTKLKEELSMINQK